MIQRIQTLYLLAVAAMLAATLFLPLAWFAGPELNYTLYAFKMVDAQGTILESPYYMGVLLTLAAVLPFVTIFLFKRRMLQFRLCVVEGVLLLGALIMEAVFYLRMGSLLSEMGAELQGFRIVALMPLFALVFVWLAARGVLHDEMLVRAADRIR